MFSPWYPRAGALTGHPLPGHPLLFTFPAYFMRNIFLLGPRTVKLIHETEKEIYRCAANNCDGKRIFSFPEKKNKDKTISCSVLCMYIEHWQLTTKQPLPHWLLWFSKIEKDIGKAVICKGPEYPFPLEGICRHPSPQSVYTYSH
jgi:hypothetical protein